MVKKCYILPIIYFYHLYLSKLQKLNKTPHIKLATKTLTQSEFEMSVIYKKITLRLKCPILNYLNLYFKLISYEIWYF